MNCIPVSALCIGLCGLHWMHSALKRDALKRGALKRELRCIPSLGLHLSAAQLAMHHHGVVLYSIECVVHWTVWIAFNMCIEM